MWVVDGPTGQPGIAVAGDDPLGLMYTSGTESRPRRDPQQRLAHRLVRGLHRRRRHDRRRHRGARSAAVPRRATGLLLLAGRLPGCDQCHPSRPAHDDILEAIAQEHVYQAVRTPAGGHDPAALGADLASRLRRRTDPQRRDARRRRPRPLRSGGHCRRDRTPQPAGDARLLQRGEEDRGGLRNGCCTPATWAC